ncbi:flavoprotein [Pelosinus propionicus]|uniref:Flavoprotein n=1 Tax=Pelosinus propionicus DSM 13327 TaxID=1123291 RepID=A0A1I4H440_9FIRM|nr:flavoprotein [Pelosinus propionicus]SFL36407.1 Flavoprotein [Pelosinus propionicus DSM 13327]
MDNEEMVQLVTAEILRQLQQNPVIAQGQSVQIKHKALVIFTGGTIGFEQGLAEIKKLQGLCFAITAVLSAAAEQILGIERVTEALGSHIDIVTAHSPYPGKALREADIVIVPVLTQNTAAKLSHTLSDTMVSTLILQGLMMGKPVIAAYNAADPLDSWRAQYTMGNSSPGLIKALQGNLQKLADFGMELVPVESIAAVSQKRLCQEAQMKVSHTTEQPVSKSTHKKTVLDAAAIQTAAQNGTKSITVPKGAILTPLARDIARECGVELVQG